MTDKKTKIENLYKQGYSSKAIIDKLGMDTGYTLRIINDIENQKKRGNTDIGKAKEEKRIEMVRLQNRQKDLMPFENERAREEFHRLDKELTALRMEYCYLERVK